MDGFFLENAIDGRMTPQYVRKSLLMARLALWEVRRDDAGDFIILASRDFKAMLGWPIDEFPIRFGDYLDQCVHPEEREPVAVLAGRYMGGDVAGPNDMDLRLRHRQSGEWRWYRVLCDAGDGDGAPDAIFGCIIDIHETHRAREELRASEAALKLERDRVDAIIDASGVLVWDWNLVDDTSVVVGGAFGGTKKLSMAAKPTVENWDSVMSREEQEKIVRAKDRLVAGETSMFEVEIELRREGGGTYWGLDRGKVVERDGEGRPTRMMGVTLNIDSLKKTAEALAKSQMYLKQVVEATNVAIWDWDLATDAVTVNENYARMLGYGPDEIMPTMSEVMRLVHPDDVRAILDFNAAICKNPGESRQYNMRLRGKDGKYVWMFGRGLCLGRDAGGCATRVVGMQMDFTHWKRLEEKQTESLSIISRQKETLEKQLAERLELINEVQRHVEKLVDAPGNRLDLVQKRLRRKLADVHGEIKKDGADAGDAFGRYVEMAFQLIANEMTWYKAVLDNLPFPTSVLDLTRRWYYLNQPAAEIMGGSEPADFLGSYYDEGWKNYVDSDQVFLDERTGKKNFTRRLLDGNRFFQCQSSFLLGENNRPLGLIETMQDITATYEAEERIKLMLDATPIACSFFGDDGALLDCNMNAAAICGVSDKAEYIEHFYDYMPPALPDGRDARLTLKNAVREAFENGSAEVDLFYLRNRDGVDIPGEVRMFRVGWRESFIVLGYFTDIGRLLAARNQLDRERLKLREILDHCPVCFSISRDNVVKFVTAHTRDTLHLNVGDHYSKMLDPSVLAELRSELNARGDRSIAWRPITLKPPGGAAARYMLTVMDIEFEGKPASMAWYVNMESLEARMAGPGGGAADSDAERRPC